jgi:hypothetical protein
MLGRELKPYAPFGGRFFDLSAGSALGLGEA